MLLMINFAVIKQINHSLKTTYNPNTINKT